MREMQIILEGSAMRETRRAWLIAHYSKFAFHQPNEMPPDPAGDGGSQKVSDEVAEEMARIQRRVKLEADMARSGTKHGS